MDPIKPEVIKNTHWTERISKNAVTGPIHEEKEMIIDRYEKVLNFLKCVQINNEEDLVHIKKPLDELKSCLKYIPNGPLFKDVIPTELKDTILSYLCDCGAFIAASVCQEWRDISDKRLKKKEVVIGEVWSRCEDNVCVKPALEDMFKAAAAHKLDVHLVICQPVAEIDKELVTDALTSVSKFTVVNDYVDGNEDVPILSTGQFEHLFESIENGDKIMEEVKLVQLKENLKDLNQEKLARFLVSKVKRLTLDDTVLDFATFMTKLQQDSSNVKLTHLTLDRVYFEITTELADALCKVENVELCGTTFISLTSQVMRRLMENMLQRPIMMKTLVLRIENDDDLRHESVREGIVFESLINPQDLKILFRKMENLSLEGFFTLEQLEAVKSLPDVHVDRIKIDGSEDFFHSVEKFSRLDLYPF